MDLQITRHGARITMRAEDLEHILACLANQKFINDVNADGISQGKRVVDRTRQSSQRAIDKAYRQMEAALRDP